MQCRVNGLPTVFHKVDDCLRSCDGRQRTARDVSVPAPLRLEQIHSNVYQDVRGFKPCARRVAQRRDLSNKVLTTRLLTAGTTSFTPMSSDHTPLMHRRLVPTQTLFH